MIYQIPTPKPRPAPVLTQEPERAPAKAPPIFVVAQPEYRAPVTPAQLAALDLYRRGFNVAPARIADKRPYLWRVLVASRVISPDAGKDPREREANYRTFLELFDNGAGVLVVLGRLSMNLTILDAETPAVAKAHQREFARRGLQPWIVRTPRGGAHFWWLSAEGEIANDKDKDGARQWEIRGNTCYCLCPPSSYLNRETGELRAYEWIERDGDLPPVLTRRDLDWLPLELAIVPRRKFVELNDGADADPLAFLSKRNRDFLENGAPEGSRNDRLFAAACDFKGNQIGEYDAAQQLTRAAERSRLASKEIGATIRKAYRKPRTPAKGQKSQTQTAPEWVRALAFAEAHTWQAISGAYGRVSADTAREVFLAMCERARRQKHKEGENSKVFRASCRELAELANVKAYTAQKAIAALVDAGLIEHRGYDDYSRAGLFVFGKEVREKWYSRKEGVCKLCTTFRADGFTDLFRQGALGKAAGRVWRLLLTGARSPKEIAKALKIHPATVRTALAKLAGAQLVSKLEGGAWIGNSAEDATLAALAHQRGTNGKSAARREQHARDRAQFVTRRLLNAKRWWEKKNLRGAGGVCDDM